MQPVLFLTNGEETRHVAFYTRDQINPRLKVYPGLPSFRVKMRKRMHCFRSWIPFCEFRSKRTLHPKFIEEMIIMGLSK